MITYSFFFHLFFLEFFCCNNRFHIYNLYIHFVYCICSCLLLLQLEFIFSLQSLLQICLYSNNVF
jgi:hypothetical protein